MPTLLNECPVCYGDTDWHINPTRNPCLCHLGPTCKAPQFESAPDMEPCDQPAGHAGPHRGWSVTAFQRVEWR